MTGPPKRSSPYETLSRETPFRCPYWHLVHDRYRLPDGSVADYYFVRTGGSTMLVPVEDSGRLVLVRQRRYLMDRDSEEFPCGGVPVGGDPDKNAVKELREEAGLEAGRLERIGAFAPYNGVADEMCHVYLARELRRVGAAPEATEAIEVMSRRVDEVAAMIAAGAIWDGMTIAAFSIARPRL
ncbi:MAG: NUDIX hydrolase [Planctomycetes bacterium]|nr:NUDIX hydrolase [Planctomycetota bacterium]